MANSASIARRIRVDHDQVIETFGPNRPQGPFGDRVGPRRPRRGAHPIDTQAGQLAVEVTAMNGISVVDEVFGVPPGVASRSGARSTQRWDWPSMQPIRPRLRPLGGSRRGGYAVGW